MTDAEDREGFPPLRGKGRVLYGYERDEAIERFLRWYEREHRRVKPPPREHALERFVRERVQRTKGKAGGIARWKKG